MASIVERYPEIVDDNRMVMIGVAVKLGAIPEYVGHRMMSAATGMSVEASIAASATKYSNKSMDGVGYMGLPGVFDDRILHAMGFGLGDLPVEDSSEASAS